MFKTFVLKMARAKAIHWRKCSKFVRQRTRGPGLQLDRQDPADAGGDGGIPLHLCPLHLCTRNHLTHAARAPGGSASTSPAMCATADGGAHGGARGGTPGP